MSFSHSLPSEMHSGVVYTSSRHLIYMNISLLIAEFSICSFSFDLHTIMHFSALDQSGVYRLFNMKHWVKTTMNAAAYTLINYRVLNNTQG